MGIPACTQQMTNSLRLGPTAMNFWLQCDKWVALHVITTFFSGVYTRKWWFAFVVAMLGETLEYFALTVLGSFSIFVATGNPDNFTPPNDDIESLGQTFVVDIVIAGGIGTILSWIYYNCIESPELLKWDDLWKRPLRFWYYFFILFGILIILPGALYDIKFGSYQFGITLAQIIYLFAALVMLATAPESTWKEFKPQATSVRTAKWIFFFTWFGVAFVFNLQNHFDYFYGGGAQVVLWSSILALVGIAWGSWRWHWWNNIYFSYIWKN